MRTSLQYLLVLLAALLLKAADSNKSSNIRGTKQEAENPELIESSENATSLVSTSMHFQCRNTCKSSTIADFSADIVIVCELKAQNICLSKYIVMCLIDKKGECDWQAVEESCDGYTILSSSSDCPNFKEQVQWYNYKYPERCGNPEKYARSKRWTRRWGPQFKRRAAFRRRGMLRMVEGDSSAAASASSSSGGATPEGIVAVPMPGSSGSSASSASASGPNSVAYTFDGEKFVVSQGSNGGPAVATSGNAHAYSSNSNGAVESYMGSPPVAVAPGGPQDFYVAQSNNAVAMTSGGGGAAVMEGPGAVSVVSNGPEAVGMLSGDVLEAPGEMGIVSHGPGQISMMSHGPGKVVTASSSGGHVPFHPFQMFGGGGHNPFLLMDQVQQIQPIPATSVFTNLQGFIPPVSPVMPTLPKMPKMPFFPGMQVMHSPTVAPIKSSHLRPVAKLNKDGTIVKHSVATADEIKDYYDNLDAGVTSPSVSLLNRKSNKRKSFHYGRHKRGLEPSSVDCASPTAYLMELYMNGTDEDNHACQFILTELCERRRILMCERPSRHSSVNCFWRNAKRNCDETDITSLTLNQCQYKLVATTL